MTLAKPTISYGHGFCDDMSNATVGNWVAAPNSNMTMAPIVVVNDDVFDMQGTATGGTPYGGWQNSAALGLSTTVYAYVRIRYKVSGAGCNANFTAVFHDATAQVLFVGASPTWKTILVALTTAKTLDTIQMFVTGASGHLYVDFALVYKADFPIPNVMHVEDFKVQGRLALLEPFGMLGESIQNLGNLSAVVEMHCDLDIGNWLRAGDNLPGQVFLDIIHNSAVEPFQWIDLGVQVAQFKVLLDMPNFQYAAAESKASHTLNLTFREYRRSPANSETVNERFGLDL